MGHRREDVDLELVLRNPRCARAWIDGFRWDDIGRPQYLVWGIDRKIYLDNMDDDEAVMAAFILLLNQEIPRVVTELQLYRGFIN